MIEDLREKQAERIRKKKKKRRKRLFLLLGAALVAAAALVLFFLGRSDGGFEVTYYQMTSEKVGTQIRLAVLSDLHGVEYGEGNSGLVAAIVGGQPDLIVMVGDMINKDDATITPLRELCRELKETAPVYYSMGNHEGSMMNGRLDSIPIDKLLEEDGVHVLYNKCETVTVRDTVIEIAGISTGAENYDRWSKEKIADFWGTDHFKLLLSHYPDLYYSKLKDAPMDLALAGHYHGGLIRLPGLGGLYHPEGGFLPKYDGGMYHLTNGTLIVSRGLGNHGIIPRINNPPELVIVDINCEE